jgi:hypothetical protein
MLNRNNIKPTIVATVEETAERIFTEKMGKMEGDILSSIIETEKTKKEIEKVNYLLVGVVFAFFVAFVTLFVGVAQVILDSNRFRTTMYDDLRVALSTQDNIIQGYQISSIAQDKTLGVEELKNRVNLQQSIIECLRNKGYFSQECLRLK